MDIYLTDVSRKLINYSGLKANVYMDDNSIYILPYYCHAFHFNTAR